MTVGNRKRKTIVPTLLTSKETEGLLPGKQIGQRKKLPLFYEHKLLNRREDVAKLLCHSPIYRSGKEGKYLPKLNQLIAVERVINTLEKRPVKPRAK